VEVECSEDVGVCSACACVCVVEWSLFVPGGLALPERSGAVTECGVLMSGVERRVNTVALGVWGQW
jgi:hypothetical protein